MSTYPGNHPNYIPFQQTFLGASITSFNINVGYNSDSTTMNINLIEDDAFIRGANTGEYDTKGNWIDSISASDIENLQYETDKSNKFKTPVGAPKVVITRTDSDGNEYESLQYAGAVSEGYHNWDSKAAPSFNFYDADMGNPKDLEGKSSRTSTDRSNFPKANKDEDGNLRYTKGDVFYAPRTGSPAYFKYYAQAPGANHPENPDCVPDPIDPTASPPHPNQCDDWNDYKIEKVLEFNGLVKSFSKSMSTSGETFSVSLEDPRVILENTIVILSDDDRNVAPADDRFINSPFIRKFSDPIVPGVAPATAANSGGGTFPQGSKGGYLGAYNVLNVYGFYEKNQFGSAETNEAGMQWYDNTTSKRKRFYNIEHEFGILPALSLMLGYGIDPNGDIVQDNKYVGFGEPFGGPIYWSPDLREWSRGSGATEPGNFDAHRYAVDLTSLYALQKGVLGSIGDLTADYRISGNQMSLLSLIQEVCETAGADFIVSMEEPPTNSRYSGIIKIDLISRKRPTTEGVIRDVIEESIALSSSANTTLATENPWFNSVSSANIGFDYANPLQSQILFGSHKTRIVGVTPLGGDIIAGRAGLWKENEKYGNIYDGYLVEPSDTDGTNLYGVPIDGLGTIFNRITGYTLGIPPSHLTDSNGELTPEGKEAWEFNPEVIPTFATDTYNTDKYSNLKLNIHTVAFTDKNRTDDEGDDENEVTDLKIYANPYLFNSASLGGFLGKKSFEKEVKVNTGGEKKKLIREGIFRQDSDTNCAAPYNALNFARRYENDSELGKFHSYSLNDMKASAEFGALFNLCLDHTGACGFNEGVTCNQGVPVAGASAGDLLWQESSWDDISNVQTQVNKFSALGDNIIDLYPMWGFNTKTNLTNCGSKNKSQCLASIECIWGDDPSDISNCAQFDANQKCIKYGVCKVGSNLVETEVKGNPIKGLFDDDDPYRDYDRDLRNENVFGTRNNLVIPGSYFNDEGLTSNRVYYNSKSRGCRSYACVQRSSNLFGIKLPKVQILCGIIEFNPKTNQKEAIDLTQFSDLQDDPLQRFNTIIGGSAIAPNANTGECPRKDSMDRGVCVQRFSRDVPLSEFGLPAGSTFQRTGLEYRAKGEIFKIVPGRCNVNKARTKKLADQNLQEKEENFRRFVIFDRSNIVEQIASSAIHPWEDILLNEDADQKCWVKGGVLIDETQSDVLITPASFGAASASVPKNRNAAPEVESITIAGQTGVMASSMSRFVGRQSLLCRKFKSKGALKAYYDKGIALNIPLQPIDEDAKPEPVSVIDEHIASAYPINSYDILDWQNYDQGKGALPENHNLDEAEISKQKLEDALGGNYKRKVSQVFSIGMTFAKTQRGCIDQTFAPVDPDEDFEYDEDDPLRCYNVGKKTFLDDFNGTIISPKTASIPIDLSKIGYHGGPNFPVTFGCFNKATGQPNDCIVYDPDDDRCEYVDWRTSKDPVGCKELLNVKGAKPGDKAPTNPNKSRGFAFEKIFIGGNGDFSNFYYATVTELRAALSGKDQWINYHKNIDNHLSSWMGWSMDDAQGPTRVSDSTAYAAVNAAGIDSGSGPPDPKALDNVRQITQDSEEAKGLNSCSPIKITSQMEDQAFQIDTAFSLITKVAEVNYGKTYLMPLPYDNIQTNWLRRIPQTANEFEDRWATADAGWPCDVVFDRSRNTRYPQNANFYNDEGNLFPFVVFPTKVKYPLDLTLHPLNFQKISPDKLHSDFHSMTAEFDDERGNPTFGKTFVKANVDKTIYWLYDVPDWEIHHARQYRGRCVFDFKESDSLIEGDGGGCFKGCIKNDDYEDPATGVAPPDWKSRANSSEPDPNTNECPEGHSWDKSTPYKRRVSLRADCVDTNEVHCAKLRPYALISIDNPVEYIYGDSGKVKALPGAAVKPTKTDGGHPPNESENAGSTPGSLDIPKNADKTPVNVISSFKDYCVPLGSMQGGVERLDIGTSFVAVSHMDESGTSNPNTSPSDTLQDAKEKSQLVPARYKPWAAGVPQISNRERWGPWAMNQGYGKAEVLIDDNYHPGAFGAEGILNDAAQAKVFFSTTGIDQNESGSVTLAGLPKYKPGKPIQFGLNSSSPRYGPYITDISVDIGDGGLKTTYNLSRNIRFGDNERQEKRLRDNQKLLIKMSKKQTDMIKKSRIPDLVKIENRAEKK